MISRQKLLDAAIRVYQAHGFRGATTRRIAEEAGVNEITIFRLFGSKGALIEAAIQAEVADTPETAALPAVPEHPERELTAWCTLQYAGIRDRRSLIRKTMSEADERPEVHPCGTGEAECAAHELKGYIGRLARDGWITFDDRRGRSREEYMSAAASMLMGAIFADAMGRDFMPEMYPEPADRALALYVRLFLRAVGVVRVGDRARVRLVPSS